MKLTESETLQSSKIVKERKEKNLPVYNAGLGENPFTPHKLILDVFVQHISHKQYTSPNGIDILQQTLKDTYSTPTYNVTNSIIGNGLKELIFILMTACTDYKLYIVTPCWVSYLEQANITGIEYECITTNIKNNYKLTPSLLEQSLQNSSKKPLLFLNNPTNPTGAIYYKNELKDLSLIMKKYDVLVCSDEIYMNLVYPSNSHKTCSICSYYNKVIIGSSLSKDCTVGGWRLGWLTFTDDTIDIYKKIYILSSSIYSCSSTPLQYVANYFLQKNVEIKNYIYYMNIFFSRLGNYCYNRLQKMDIYSSHPEGAWYIFLDFSNYEQKLENNHITNSTALVTRLIHDIGLVTVSGKSFGYKGLTLRYSFVDVITPHKDILFDEKIKNITQGLDMLDTWLKRL